MLESTIDHKGMDGSAIFYLKCFRIMVVEYIIRKATEGIKKNMTIPDASISEPSNF